MNLFNKLTAFFRAKGWTFIFCGILLIIAGLRFAITDRNVAGLPTWDDWCHLEFLRSFSTDKPDYGYPFRYHFEHFYAATPVISWIAYKLNGLWDVRMETLAYSLLYVAYAAMLMRFFLKLTDGRGKLVLCLLSLVFLALPVSGHKASWGFLTGFPVAMLFALGAVQFSMNLQGRWSRVAGALICAGLATGALAGCGSLAGLSIAFVVGVRAWRQRDWNPQVLTLILGLMVYLGLAIFTKPPPPTTPPVVTLPIILSAITRSLAWPSVFAPPACLFNLLPCILLAVAWWRDPKMRTPAVEAILTMQTFLFLQAAGVAVFRGENNNMAMPSNRYYDILLTTPFVAAAACIVLLRAYPVRVMPRVASWLLMLSLAGGASIHFFYRMWPYVARENGEWPEAVKVDRVREMMANGWQAPEQTWDNEANETDVTMDFELRLFREWVEKKGDDPVLPGTMVTGHPLKAQEAGPFVREGYNNTYPPRPATQYWGSYGDKRSMNTGSFISEPFTAHGACLVFDFVLPKKSRFSFYKLPGCELNVVDVETGEKIPVLPRLARTLPSLLRDREAVTVPVTAGRKYRVEASDTATDSWFAFSEPADGGRLTPVAMAINSSGKLLAMLGVILAAAGWFGLRFGTPTPLQPDVLS